MSQLFMRLCAVFLCIISINATAANIDISHITGKWSIETSCKSNFVLTNNRQVVGKNIIGTWETRGELIELNIASKTGGERYAQVLLTPVSKKRLQVLSVYFPFQQWDWPQKKHQLLKKCR